MNYSKENLFEIKKKDYTFIFSENCPKRDELIDEILQSDNSERTILKKDEKRLVYSTAHKSGLPYIVKKNLLPRLKDRFRAKRFADNEFFCHRKVEQMAVTVPQIWGMFRQKGYSLTVSNGVFIEFLEGAVNLSLQESEKAAEIIALLYEKGINHPDLMRNNIMRLSNDKLILIDLEQCTFVQPCDIRIALMNLARFIEYNELSINLESNQRLIRETYKRLSNPQINENEFFELVKILNKKHLKSKARARLQMPEEALQKLKEYSET